MILIYSININNTIIIIVEIVFTGILLFIFVYCLSIALFVMLTDSRR